MPTGYDFTKTDVINILKEKNCILLSDYSNCKEKISIIDENGYKYKDTFISLKNHKLNKPFSKNNPYTIDNIKTWIKINNLENDIELLSNKYISATEKLLWKCKRCGDLFERDWHYMQKDNNTNKICSKCNRNNLTISQTDYESYKDFEKLGYKILGAYNGKHKKCTLLDKEGYLYYTSHNILFYNKHPYRYSIFNPYTIYNINNCIKINKLPVKLISDEFLGGDKALEWECECGNHFFEKPCNVLLKNGNKNNNKRLRCKLCTKSQSNISKKTEDYLNELNIKYKKEFRFSDCKDKSQLPFDYAIFNDNNELIGLIEVDGQQHFYSYGFKFDKNKEEQIKHFEYVKKHDDIKNNYCKENNIKLLRIPFWDYDKRDKYKDKVNEFMKNI